MQVKDSDQQCSWVNPVSVGPMISPSMAG